MYIKHKHHLTLAYGIGCEHMLCPAEEYLSSRPDVLTSRIRNNEADKSSSNTEIWYGLNLETENIGDKFIKVYKEAQRICAECGKHKQALEK